MSANSRMRRAIFLAFVLLVVSTVIAAANAAESKTTHRKAASSTHKSTQTSAHRTSKTSVRHTSRRTKSSRHKTSKAKAQKTASTPQRSSAAPTPTADTTAYAIGYRAGYEAGRAAALKEIGTKSTGDTATDRSLQSAPLPAASTQPQQTAQPAGIEPSVDEPRQTRRAQIDSAASASPDDSEPIDGVKDPDEATMVELELPRPGTPISLRGSLASLQRQNTRLESEGLERILDENDLDSRIAHGLLVPLPATANMTVNPNLAENHRYCRAWTARFLSDLAKAHAAAFHRPFQVNSAVRTVEYQKRLMRVNGNAAAAEGDIVSPHLTGATIDIGKQGMTHTELMWMRRHLLALQNAGKIDVEEEFAQACFHITVYKTYTHTQPARKIVPPPLREASAPGIPPNHAPRRGSSLPSSIAAGTLIPQGR